MKLICLSCTTSYPSLARKYRNLGALPHLRNKSPPLGKAVQAQNCILCCKAKSFLLLCLASFAKHKLTKHCMNTACLSHSHTNKQSLKKMVSYLAEELQKPHNVLKQQNGSLILKSASHTTTANATHTKLQQLKSSWKTPSVLATLPFSMQQLLKVNRSH